MLWLAVVVVGTGIAGLFGQLPGVEPAPYILRFNEDRPNPFYRRFCYTLAWSEVVSYALLNIAGLVDAIVNGTWRMRAIYDAGYFPIAGTFWLLGAVGWLAAGAPIDEGRRAGAALLLRLGVGRLHRAAGSLVFWKVAAADAGVRHPASSSSSRHPRVRRQPGAPRRAPAHAADPARRDGGRGLIDEVRSQKVEVRSNWAEPNRCFVLLPCHFDLSIDVIGER